MMLPASPMAHFIVGQTGFARAALEAFFDTMFGLATRAACWGVSGAVGQIITDLHDLLIVAVTVVDHHQQFLIALLTPMGSRHHPSFDYLNHQWLEPSRTSIRCQASRPGLGSIPPRLPGHWGRPRPLGAAAGSPDHDTTYAKAPPACTAPPTPPADGETSTAAPSHRHRNPAMRRRGTIARQHLQGQWVPRAVASAGGGYPGFVQPGLIVPPLFGQVQPQVNQNVALARHVAQVDGHLAVVDFAQPTAPLLGHLRLPTGLGNPEGSNTNTPAAVPKWVLTWRINSERNGASSHSSQPMQPCRGRRDWPKRYAIDSLFLRSTSDSRPQTEVLACCMRVGPWKVSTKGAIKVCKRGMTWSKILGRPDIPPAIGVCEWCSGLPCVSSF